MSPLSEEEKRIILHKGTESPYQGKYTDNKKEGTYVCRACGFPLYRSDDKFESGCGWPSFDDEIPGAVNHLPDADGNRVEIVCANCDGHLGHVFRNEGFTPKNTRHCVNSISMHFVPAGDELPEVERQSKPEKIAVFAGGCFWGLEHAFSLVPGVLDVVSGYSGGHTPTPGYEEVCRGRTGHAEAVQVRYDPQKVDYETLVRLFFEMHDPTQINRQGVDVGSQYRSVLFYNDEGEKEIALQLVEKLEAKGYRVVTEIVPATVFYPAEEYHQDYLMKHPNRPSCHFQVRRFD